LAAALFALLGAYRGAVRQERTFVRLVHLSVAGVLCLGRHTVSQLLVALGVGELDWSAWHRLFAAERIDVAAMQAVLVGQVAAATPAGAPAFAAAVDATQLPRSSRRFPGAGLTVSPRSPRWLRGLHPAQRFVGISALLPRSAAGDSRAVPLRWLLLRTAKTAPMGDEPERTEGAGAVALVAWLRQRLDDLDRAGQRLLVLGDGAYSNAKVLAALPERVVLLARCARNRALYAPPAYRRTGRGRQPRYGERGPTPEATLHQATGWRTSPIAVRGRTVPVTAKVTGPWLVKGAPFAPLALVVVRGVDRGRGTTRRQREPQFFLVTLRMAQEDEWALPLPLPELLAWAWQRWEVEVMHRELKGGFGLGEQQAFSQRGAATVIPWAVWVYALTVLAGYRAWGLGPGAVPDLGRWGTARRWSVGRLRQGLRRELWQLGEFQPVWSRSPDAWAEIAAWVAARTNATAGARRLRRRPRGPAPPPGPRRTARAPSPGGRGPLPWAPNSQS
jgi:hypothetical protein